VGSDSTTTGCWGPSSPPTLTGSNANSDGETNASQINGADNALNGQDVLANGFSEIGVNLTQAIKAAGGTSQCFANETWVSRSSGSSFTSSPEMVVRDQQPTCGEVKIIKQTNPRGLDQVFSFTSNLPANSTAGGVKCTSNSTSAGVQSDGSFCLNDTGNAGKTLGSSSAANNSAGNTVDENNLPPGSYTVSESTTDPTGFAYSSITCTPSGSATIDNPTRTATITLGISGVVVCVVQNNQQLGAIKISKTSSKPAHTPLNGAHFQICSNDGPYNTGTNHDQNPCNPVKTGSGDLQTSGTGASVCIEGLPFGSNYYVSEKSPPSGYSNDSGATTTQVTVNVNTTCSGTPQSVTYRDTPLTDLTVHVASEASGGTASRISCVSGSTAIGNSPQPADVSGVQQFGDPETVTANGLAPGTYTCTVVIDP
jgi:hypothetical protein